MAASNYVREVTRNDFEQVVIEGSYRVPVLVDFWAAWCAPCQMLMPVLAKIADDFGGKILVAKVNSDEQQELAQRHGVRSLPTVKLFRNGVPVDEFMGALPESAVREFLAAHVERESDHTRALALEAHGAGDTAKAITLLRGALAADPDNPRTPMDLLQLLMESGRFGEARALIEDLPASRQADADLVAVAARLRFAAAVENAPDLATLNERVAVAPDDCQARYQLAAHRVLAGDYEGALEQLLEVLRRDRSYGDDAGRNGMLAVFQMLGGSGPLVNRYRSLMSSALY